MTHSSAINIFRIIISIIPNFLCNLSFITYCAISMCWCGQEPTTDSFIVVSHGEEEGIIPGNALVVDGKKPFRALAKFGNAFLNRSNTIHCQVRLSEGLAQGMCSVVNSLRKSFPFRNSPVFQHLHLLLYHLNLCVLLMD